MMLTEAQVHMRLAAYDEFMVEYRQKHWPLYANPDIPPEYKHGMDEAVRSVFYRAFDAGVGSSVVSNLFGKGTPK